MEDKTPQAIFGAIVSGAGWVGTFLQQNISLFAGVVAIGAGIFSLLSSWETIKYRRAQRKKLEMQINQTTTESDI